MLRNRIIYTALTLLTAALYLWTDSAVALALVVAMVAVAVFSFVAGNLTARATTVEIEHAPACRAGESVPMNIRILSKGIHIPLGYFDLKVKGTNPVFHEVWTEETAFESGWERVVDYSGFLTLDDYGIVSLEVDSCRLCGSLGLFNRAVPCKVQSNLVVYPPNAAMAATVGRRPRARAMGETFSDMRRGNDVNEVFDIRDYQPGDVMNSIHWKLSSKLDRIVSREFSEPSHYEVMVASDAALRMGDQDIDHGLISSVAGVQLAISQNLLRNQISHSMALSNDYDIELYPLEGPSDLSQVEEMMLSQPLDQQYRSMAIRLIDWGLDREFTKVILVTCVYDNDAWAKLGAVTDLTVVIVTPHSLSGTAGENYSLIALDAEGLSDHVHRIEI